MSFWLCTYLFCSKRFDDPELFPMIVTHKDHKLSFDKNADEKLIMKVDDKEMFEYQYLSLVFSK